MNPNARLSQLDRGRIELAIGPNPWDLSNEVLYDLCRKHPSHRRADEILAKILLIGRVYAAAIERRKGKTDLEENDNFYTEVVAPKLQQSDIDNWISEAKAAQPGTTSGLTVLVEVHGRTTRLFSEISNMDKRSLASKYLHFHVPKLFYIYDSRAVEAMRKFSSVLPRASKSSGMGDNEYRKFAEKCHHLSRMCEEEFKVHILPRQLDNLLLGTGGKTGVK